jgi:nucleotidyltransferase/DNA polymerase involved in DNA repair
MDRPLNRITVSNGARTIFHVDMDAFFASVEQRDFPHYRNKPVIVGAKIGTRGVVSAASYEARKYGIHSAMPISEAFRRCPKGLFIQPRMAVYESVSSELMDFFARYSPVIEQISVDEAFLDMTGSDRLFGSPLHIAKTIAKAIQTSHHLTASIGIAPNKFCAKIASDLNKPNGITLCPNEPSEIMLWLAPMPVERIWGVGKQTASALENMGIQTIADLQLLSPETLIDRFGKSGGGLYYLARGIDERPVCTDNSYKSISREYTFNTDSGDRDDWQSTIFTLAQDVARRARKHGVKGNVVYITYRRPDFSRHTRRQALHPPTNAARYIFEGALNLLSAVSEYKLRLIGVGISGLDTPLQVDLFEDDVHRVRLERSEKAVDILTGRFGATIIKKGRELKKNKTKIDTPDIALKTYLLHNQHKESS